MQINADEISKILAREIKDYASCMVVSEVGTVISVGDGIARIHGLDQVMAGELLDFPHGVKGSRSTWKRTTWARCFSANIP